MSISFHGIYPINPESRKDNKGGNERQREHIVEGRRLTRSFSLVVLPLFFLALLPRRVSFFTTSRNVHVTQREAARLGSGDVE